MERVNSFCAVPEDKTNLVWSVSRQSSGTAGSFLKSFEIIDGRKVYYKASNYDSVRGFVGHESLNEVVACNIAAMLGIEHLTYELLYGIVNVREKDEATLFTKSFDFKNAGERKMTFESFYALMKDDGESLKEFIERLSLQRYFYDMFLLDWIICNRDRHGANIEVLLFKNGFRMAPLFDHGLSFAFPCYEFRDITMFDFLKDSPVNNYVGSCILSDNLKSVPKAFREKVELVNLEQLFLGIEQYKGIIPCDYFDAIREMVKVRVDYVKKI